MQLVAGDIDFGPIGPDLVGFDSIELQPGSLCQTVSCRREPLPPYGRRGALK
jgi:hypothetical protein